jgi:hypothetical protein
MDPITYRITCQVAADCRDDLARRLVAAQAGVEPSPDTDPIDYGEDSA